MISKVARLCGPPKSAELVEPRAKRVKARKELDGGELKSERYFIDDGEELLYALGKLNAEKGGKYKFGKYLGSNWRFFWNKYPNDKKKWSHVSMYAQESNGENVCQESNGKNVCQESNAENVWRKIIFAELCYYDGKYESVNATVLDPNKPEEIKYGCGFCFLGYVGEPKNPHPADPSAYTMGHWPHCSSPCSHGGFIPRWSFVPDAPY